MQSFKIIYVVFSLIINKKKYIYIYREREQKLVLIYVIAFKINYIKESQRL